MELDGGRRVVKGVSGAVEQGEEGQDTPLHTVNFCLSEIGSIVHLH